MQNSLLCFFYSSSLWGIYLKLAVKTRSVFLKKENLSGEHEWGNMSTRASRDDASMISATNIKLLHTIMMSARLKNYLAVLLYVSVFSLLAQGDGVNNGISWPAGGDAPAVGNGERRQYVFLFSNGHVGTTSLGNAKAYPVPDRPCSNTACFFYEQNNV